MTIVRSYEDPPTPPPHLVMADPRTLLAFVKLAIQDLLPLAVQPQHKAIRVYAEAAIEMMDTHCILYDLDEWSRCKELPPELQELLSRSGKILSRLLKVKAAFCNEEDIDQ